MGGVRGGAERVDSLSGSFSWLGHLRGLVRGGHMTGGHMTGVAPCHYCLTETLQPIGPALEAPLTGSDIIWLTRCFGAESLFPTHTPVDTNTHT